MLEIRDLTIQYEGQPPVLEHFNLSMKKWGNHQYCRRKRQWKDHGYPGCFGRFGRRRENYRG